MFTKSVCLQKTPCSLNCRNVGAGAHTSTAVRPTYDRILRYPDGAVRTIRYPDSVSQRPTSEHTTAIEASISDWHICGENDSSCTFDPNFDDECFLPGAAPVEQLWGATAPGTQPAPAEKDLDYHRSDKFDQLPDSPAALLEFLASDEYRQAQEAQQDRIRNSFKVLNGCPWVAQRPLLTVVVPQRGRDEPAAYTLPVAIEQVLYLPYKHACRSNS